jgi:proteasome lid subunit RPN8/RPN11
MPVNTIELPRELRHVVDAFILSDPTKEYGGFLFGTPLRFHTFLPIPNVSPTPGKQYKAPDDWKRYTDAFAGLIGYDVVAQVHTHPSHSIPSEQDVKASQFWFQHARYLGLIAPNVEGNRTTWWIVDRQFEVQELLETDATLDTASLLVARRYGFANLGAVLMDNHGHLKAQGKIPQTLLDHPDARQLYAKLLHHGKSDHQNGPYSCRRSVGGTNQCRAQRAGGGRPRAYRFNLVNQLFSD